MPWAPEELRKIASADDLHIWPLREDGKTYGAPTGIWSVAVGDALYVRAYKASLALASGRHQTKGGRITAAGITKNVVFEAVSGPTNTLIEDAYRTKYSSSPDLDAMIGVRARSATVEILPCALDGRKRAQPS
jgi:hypothetical protein